MNAAAGSELRATIVASHQVERLPSAAGARVISAAAYRAYMNRSPNVIMPDGTITPPPTPLGTGAVACAGAGRQNFRRGTLDSKRLSAPLKTNATAEHARDQCLYQTLGEHRRSRTGAALQHTVRIS